MIPVTEKRVKVLICDDSMLVRKKLRDSLEQTCGTDVFEAKDGQSAVEMYKMHRPDVVFMDIVMPLKDGIQAVREIRAFDPEAKVVMASSAGTQEHLRKAIDAGAFDFVQKPFQDERLMCIVARIREESEEGHV